jgi:hypothetical protein
MTSLHKRRRLAGRAVFWLGVTLPKLRLAPRRADDAVLVRFPLELRVEPWLLRRLGDEPWLLLLLAVTEKVEKVFMVFYSKEFF